VWVDLDRIRAAVWLSPDARSRSRSLSFWSPKIALKLFYVYLLRHFGVEPKLMVDCDMRPSLLVYSLSEPSFWISFSVSYHMTSYFAECRYYRTFKGPYFPIAWGYNHMVGRAGSTNTHRTPMCICACWYDLDQIQGQGQGDWTMTVSSLPWSWSQDLASRSWSCRGLKAKVLARDRDLIHWRGCTYLAFLNYILHVYVWCQWVHLCKAGCSADVC